MKIFSASQLKKWDEFTIAHEPVSSINLMERAAEACCKWLLQHDYKKKHFHIFCGKGNNGGDGLALARLLAAEDCPVTVYIPDSAHPGSADYLTNLEKLQQSNTEIHFINSHEILPVVHEEDIIIDALFGTGLNKPPEGINAAIINYINLHRVPVISVDLPSGLFADQCSKKDSIVKATHTLSFQHYKLAFLFPENEQYCGKVHLLDIGLHPAFEKEEDTIFELTDPGLIRKIYRCRKKFSHKGTYGHAALVTGSYGMMGAAVLSASACLRSGVGKLTAFIPGCGYNILQTSVPEAMCRVAGETYITGVAGIEEFNAVGIGPGIGRQPSHPALLLEIFQKVDKPVLIDADALNTLAEDKALMQAIPRCSVLTPHFREFERLFGSVSNDFQRAQLAMENARKYNICIVLKGHYTLIATPEGKAWFNPTGNAGMATGGTGDVLSGIITGLLAQGYKPREAAILGTYLHGLAGDIAAEKMSPEAMIAGDITGHMGDAFKQITSSSL